MALIARSKRATAAFLRYRRRSGRRHRILPDLPELSGGAEMISALSSLPREFSSRPVPYGPAACDPTGEIAETTHRVPPPRQPPLSLPSLSPKRLEM